MIKNLNPTRPTRQSITSRVANMADYMESILYLECAGRRVKLVHQTVPDDKLCNRDMSPRLTLTDMELFLDAFETGYGFAEMKYK